jgi:hypothetical protein
MIGPASPCRDKGEQPSKQKLAGTYTLLLRSRKDKIPPIQTKPCELATANNSVPHAERHAQRRYRVLEEEGNAAEHNYRLYSTLWGLRAPIQ